MALTLPIPLTVDTDVFSLPRINQDGYTGEYFDRLTDSTKRVTIQIKHTLPAVDGAVESHLVRMDLETYDGSGVYLRTDTVWTVFKTSGGVQNTTELLDLWLAMNVWLEASTNAAATAIVNREV